MLGIDISDSPDSPVGTPAVRRAIAIKWNWTTEHTQAEIADALGVRERTVRRYVQQGPTDEVRDMVASLESEVRTIAVMELKQQLKEAGHRARTAETPVKVWTDDDGRLNVKDKIHPETGEITGKYPVPHGMEIGDDDQARYYAREEVRQILDQLTDLVGAAEPEEHEVTLTDVLMGDDE